MTPPVITAERLAEDKARAVVKHMRPGSYLVGFTNEVERVDYTVDDLSALLERIEVLTAEKEQLREAFSYACGLLPGAAGAMDREADTYVLSCMVNIGELKRVQHYRSALTSPQGAR